MNTAYLTKKSSKIFFNVYVAIATIQVQQSVNQCSEKHEFFLFFVYLVSNTLKYYMYFAGRQKNNSKTTTCT